MAVRVQVRVDIGSDVAPTFPPHVLGVVHDAEGPTPEEAIDRLHPSLRGYAWDAYYEADRARSNEALVDHPGLGWWSFARIY